MGGDGMGGLTKAECRGFGRGSDIRRCRARGSGARRKSSHVTWRCRSESVHARVSRELPHGEVTVRAVAGGLRVPGADTLMACAAITVSIQDAGAS